jgi:hypothetical protein
MVDDKILIKEKNKYKLNQVWIQKLKHATIELEIMNNFVIEKYDINPDFIEPINLKFSDFRKLILFLVDIFTKKKIIGKGSNVVVASFRHLYLPFDLNFKDFNKLQRMVKSCDKSYALAYMTSPLDIWIKEQFLKAGLKDVRIGIKDELFDEGLFIHGDGIVEITSSKKTKEIIDKVYNRNNNLGDLFKEVFFRKGINQKLDFNVKIYKNPQIASLLKKQMLSYFKE